MMVQNSQVNQPVKHAQVRQNLEAMQQLVDNAKAIPSLVKLISEDQPQAIQEQAAQLLGLLASHDETAKLEAVRVSVHKCGDETE